MNYVARRDLEQLAQFDAQVSQFVRRYKQHKPAKRRTIILFPGGLASSLVRAKAPDSVTPHRYEPLWFGCSVLLGGALLLRMNGDVDETRHFVISNGCIQVPLANLQPYKRFLDWCGANGFDWFAFGWDWRRRPEDIAALFSEQFAPRFRERVRHECGADPFADITLIGHSFGGMVLKLILNRGGPLVDAISRAITVASPFYGYAGQLHRYFKGEPDLEKLSFRYNERNLVQLISSLRGPYSLLYLDEATYRRDGEALARDTAFPMLRYPVRDEATDVVADPYNPGRRGKEVRYPRGWGFDARELAKGRQIYQDVAKPLAPAINRKFHNIRAVQTRNGAAAYQTVHEQSWKWVSPEFDPACDPSPVTDDSVCPGDGIIPAWSARLVSAPAENVRTVHGDIARDRFEHMDLMLSPLIQREILDIINHGQGASPP